MASDTKIFKDFMFNYIIPLFVIHILFQNDNWRLITWAKNQKISFSEKNAILLQSTLFQILSIESLTKMTSSWELTDNAYTYLTSKSYSLKQTNTPSHERSSE